MEAHLEDLQAIVDNQDEPNFENVIAAYDRCGSLLDKVGSVYSNMGSSMNTEDLQAVQTEMSPILSRHSSATYTLPGLFDKINQVYKKRETLDLTPEQNRLVERIHLDFTRSGAHFDKAAQEEYTEIKAQLATLLTKFAQNVLKDESTYELVVKRPDLEGCPDSLIEAAKGAAKERNKEDDEYVITLGRSLVEPFLTFCQDRELRKEAWEAWTERGELDEERMNIPIATEILKLRKRMSELHGCKSFAEYQCLDSMAKTPENVMKLLENVWERAKEAADREREALEEYAKSSGESVEDGIQPWDWRYFAEKVRIAKYDFDGALMKPYFSVDAVKQAMFGVSNRLYGLKYVPRPDIEMYHPDVMCYEVREDLPDGSDKLTALFILDNYSRQFKSSGAWMSEYRTQTRNLLESVDGIEGIPIVSNNNNLAKGKNTLLSYDDAITCLHEFGHAHHGMLSDANYERLASTNVLMDFVELPSQLMENWLGETEVLKEYARHFETNESLPDELLEKLMAAESFNEGFATIEYTVCALLDMAMHQLDNYDDFDMAEFEKKELERLGMPQGIVMRHRPAHFCHLFASNGYAARYYVYQWAEVLDKDVFAAFKESGDVFDKETAAKARKLIYSAGNTHPPEELFRQFRGRDPDIKFLLKKKGLLAKA